jgi:hypothetical protein
MTMAPRLGLSLAALVASAALTGCTIDFERYRFGDRPATDDGGARDARAPAAADAGGDAGGDDASGEAVPDSGDAAAVCSEDAQCLAPQPPSRSRNS